jgi:hypothetical protein
MDSMAGCKLLRFLDCYSGYHQIPHKVKDQIKTAIITPFGAFRYTTMSFRLKIAGATYQMGTQKCLHSQLRCNAEAYIDDVVVKTQEDEGLISNLVETSHNLRKFKMRSARLVCPQECYSGIWSPGVESTLTQRKCQQ